MFKAIVVAVMRLFRKPIVEVQPASEPQQESSYHDLWTEWVPWEGKPVSTVMDVKLMGGKCFMRCRYDPSDKEFYTIKGDKRFASSWVTHTRRSN